MEKTNTKIKLKTKTKTKTKFTHEKGVALLMVMGAITILSALMASFLFETKVNKIKTNNRQDRFSAVLMAQNGLTFSMARLQIYQESLNILEKDEMKRKLVPPPILDQIWSIPFIYPITLPKDADILQRTAAAEFEKNSMLQGTMRVEIQNISHLWNLNLLRVSLKNLSKNNASNPALPAPNERPDDDFSPNGNGNGNGNPNPPPPPPNQILTNTNPSVEDIVGLESKISIQIQTELNKIKEKDESFETHYSQETAINLIKELKFFISEKDSYEDPLSRDIETKYSRSTVKHTPLSSISELYLLKGWKDPFIDLIKNNYTVHGPKLIDVNKINDAGLKLLIPGISPEQIKQFFKFRDDPVLPHYFLSFKDFSNYIVNQGRFANQNTFDERIKELRKAGIEFGYTGSLFKIISTGQMNETQVTLTAYVSIPFTSPPPKPAVKANMEGQCPQGYEPDKVNRDLCQPMGEKNPDGTLKKPPLTYLPPRIVELILN